MCGQWWPSQELKDDSPDDHFYPSSKGQVVGEWWADLTDRHSWRKWTSQFRFHIYESGLGCPKLPASHPDNKNSLECLCMFLGGLSFVFNKSSSSVCIVTFESSTLSFWPYHHCGSVKQTASLHIAHKHSQSFNTALCVSGLESSIRCLSAQYP